MCIQDCNDRGKRTYSIPTHRSDHSCHLPKKKKKEKDQSRQYSRRRRESDGPKWPRMSQFSIASLYSVWLHNLKKRKFGNYVEGIFRNQWTSCRSNFFCYFWKIRRGYISERVNIMKLVYRLDDLCIDQRVSSLPLQPGPDFNVPRLLVAKHALQTGGCKRGREVER